MKCKTCSHTLCLLLLAVFLLIFVLNVLTPLYADDYSYSYTFAVTEGKYRITNLRELFLSQINHYRVMNGRSVAHTLAQLFLMWGKPVFNIINSLAFICLGLCIDYHACGALRRIRALPLGLIYFLLWLCAPAFGQSFLWVTGSANYLYGILIILLYLIPFRQNMTDDRGMPLPAALLMLPAGVIAGWTNENNAVALIAVVVLTIILRAVQKKRFQPFMLFGAAGNIVGCLIMLLSPGERHRLDGFGGFGAIRAIVDRAAHITLQMGWYLLPSLLLLAAAVLLLIRHQRRSGTKLSLSELTPALIYLTGMLGSVYSMSAAPYFPQRAWSGPIVFSLIAALSAASLLPPYAKLRRGPLRIAVSLLMAVCFLITYIPALRDLNEVRTRCAAREAVLLQAKEDGRREAAVPMIGSSSRYSCFEESGDLSGDPDVWPNTAMAMYYGLERVVRTA